MTQKKAGPEWAQDDAETLFARYARTRDPHLRDRLVVMHQNLVRYLAGKFVNRGEPLEDLIQVGTIGLINAIDRFDSGRGTKFSTYATPTIVGEIRRYFRDKAWSLKVPRRLQELNQTASKAQEALSQQTGPPADDPGSRPAHRRDRGRDAGSHRTGQRLRHGLARQQDDARLGQRPPLAGRVRRGRGRLPANVWKPTATWTRPSSLWSRASAPSSSTASSRTCRRPRSPSSSTSRRCTSRACKTAPCTSSSA